MNITVGGKTLGIGDLRKRVVVEMRALTPDDQGGSTEEWSTLATVWGALMPVSSREKLYSAQMQYQRSHVLVIRYRSDITTDMRVLFGGRYLQVKGVRTPNEQNIFLIIDLEENQGS